MKKMLMMLAMVVMLEVMDDDLGACGEGRGIS